jgi:hypothetical protein
MAQPLALSEQTSGAREDERDEPCVVTSGTVATAIKARLGTTIRMASTHRNSFGTELFEFMGPSPIWPGARTIDSVFIDSLSILNLYII